MKKILIVIVALLVLFPITVFAFSFTDIFYFFDKKPEAVEEVLEENVEENLFSRYLAEEKYESWKTAYDNGDIRLASDSSKNLIFSEGEINYLIEKRLEDMKHSPVDNITLELQDGLIKATGRCLKRFFNGDFELDIEPTNKYGRLSFEVKRARFKGVFLPKFIASLILKGEMKETITFLHSNPDYVKVNIKVSENKLELDFQN